MNTVALDSVEHWRSTKLILSYTGTGTRRVFLFRSRGRKPIRNENCANDQSAVRPSLAVNGYGYGSGS
eukprot:scaffold67647_cov34-Attheya_sp.AAC.1